MSRRNIHYWKCDRPAAFHGTEDRKAPDPSIELHLLDAVREYFCTADVNLTAAATQGHHLTWKGVVDGRAMFFRVENGPEGDSHLEMESAVMREVRARGIPVPEVFAVDASRNRVPFAWQALESIPFPDLNHWHKQGRLDQERVAFEIGAAIAQWQAIRPDGFGAFDPDPWKQQGRFVGFRATYEDYFCLRLDAHIGFLAERQFLDAAQCTEIEEGIGQHGELRQLARGCLVHKDLALWNILGSEHHIAAFIDFDDAISGDPMDDLSLLGCFHDAAFLLRALDGYKSIRPLPHEHRRRFWLHLLRNMIVKAVIRVGAGYFDRNDSFFLIGSGSSGTDLKQFTHERIRQALQGLSTDADIRTL